MSTLFDRAGRVANLKLEGQVLTATVPSDIKAYELNAVGNSILDIIKRQTGCNCMSGRIKVVIQDDFSDVIRVDLSNVSSEGAVS
jgi:hypothetical protein